ncbi:hypothetical protein F0562_013764 [Nyssa sinensis]|uniref:Uncharacterized protein n=1 Tax=Nyssa sinensis TaxID=561372 RepID=A0A5J4ZPA9_9ASTE|nr:hypothetical protein F0562_013764 [Nyssa sinensis]
MLEDNSLLERGVGGESFGSEVGGDPTAEVFVILAHHVDEIVVAEELLAEGVAHQVEGVGADIGENFVREVGGANEDNEATDDIVGGDAKRERKEGKGGGDLKAGHDIAGAAGG